MSNVKAVIEHRQRRKLYGIEAFGSKCGICGYSKCIAALEFHHLNSNDKEVTISGKTLKFEKFIDELRKCVLLCSNCHREYHAGVISIPENITRFDENYAFKKVPEKPKHPCENCGKMTIINQKYCSIKCAKQSREIAKWPSDIEILEMVKIKGYRATGRELGVSDNAVRKRLRSRGLIA